eukprot:1000407-Prorocentrum_minimum.AAC.1
MPALARRTDGASTTSRRDTASRRSRLHVATWTNEIGRNHDRGSDRAPQVGMVEAPKPYGPSE